MATEAFPPLEPANIILRDPSTSSAPSASNPIPPPTPEQLAGTWHVTHSTLPMWKGKRNVRITYTPLEPSSAGPARLDDLVEYQTLSSDKVKTVRGVDTAAGAECASWDWRGKGWLKIAGSHWEVLGWGTEDDEGDIAKSEEGRQGGNTWAVTYFAKTVFTPAGLDFYSRDKGGLRPGTVTQIKAALEGLADPAVRTLAADIFEVTIDAGAGHES